jgi:hypothetical protein
MNPGARTSGNRLDRVEINRRVIELFLRGPLDTAPIEYHFASSANNWPRNHLIYEPEA